MGKAFFLILALVAFTFCAPKKEPPQTLVIVGVTGDLAQKKLLPAIEQLQKKGALSKNFRLIGAGRKEGYQHPALSRYVPLNQLEQLKGIEGDVVYYLSTPADSFAPTIDLLAENGLINDHARIVIEKPFGTDTATAEALQEGIVRRLKDEQIYRIDHYLGKGVVQQILPFRAAHPEIEQFLNHEHVEKIAITLSEEAGIGARGHFWEKTGMLRDVVQNHLMQVMTLIGMELPGTPQEKVNFLHAVRIEELEKKQYAGYKDEKGVSPDSRVETFVSAQLFVDTERWQGVPFVLQAGKKLDSRYAEVAIYFKAHEPLIFRIQPNERISWGDKTFHSQTVPTDAYERLLLEAMQGNPEHFVTQEELMASWQLWTPILEYWDEVPPSSY